jgi:hydroxymethylbilane synthase
MRIVTRGSPLALAQAAAVAERLRAFGAEVEIVPMVTEGDRRAGARLAEIGGKGLFVREIEEAVLAGRADLAVHSLKDLPAELPDGLALAAFPAREDAGDVLVSKSGGPLDALRVGAVVGTSSPRRRALALAARPDLVIEPIRGNVETRLGKLATASLDAVILAAAGLRRLGLVPPNCAHLPVDVFVPAVGQGILGLEARKDDHRTLALLEPLDDPASRAAALAERAFLTRLGASCTTPIAGHASLVPACGGGLVLAMTGVVCSEDGRRVLRARVTGAPERAEALGHELAETLLGRGAAGIADLRPVGWAP